ncbi:hypothetical protein [uncultured Ruegeria sp.]|uniref:hypothetical protein n=1 Tax=uncultured Ruegeria sp. TaxID=259304 RepID=UPI002631C172|nr:hypothetical protein [uncultured Ruegeria sp.]
MFNYSDPSGSDHLSRFRAISEWRGLVEAEYRSAAKRPDSAFTWIDAILDVDTADRAEATIPWKAFPIRVGGTAAQIDADRNFQEEYVEWSVFRTPGGNIDRISFTTEFREYFGVLAGVSPTGIKTAVESMNQGATPTNSELYGRSNLAGTTVRQREILFLNHLRNNPWNNGQKGILALTTPVNSIPALFGLAAFCGIERTGLPASEVCANVGGACVPGRQSDPQICTACQQQVRASRSFSLADPIGIFIQRLEGNWTIDGTQIDINDQSAVDPRWVVSRNGRRGTLLVSGAGELELDGDPITSGSQVADKLFVAATVAIADDANLPEWARTGKENLQRPDARIG